MVELQFLLLSQKGHFNFVLITSVSCECPPWAPAGKKVMGCTREGVLGPLSHQGQLSQPQPLAKDVGILGCVAPCPWFLTMIT